LLIILAPRELYQPLDNCGSRLCLGSTTRDVRRVVGVLILKFDAPGVSFPHFDEALLQRCRNLLRLERCERRINGPSQLCGIGLKLGDVLADAINTMLQVVAFFKLQKHLFEDIERLVCQLGSCSWRQQQRHHKR
jgi:hypothetical protein